MYDNVYDSDSEEQWVELGPCDEPPEGALRGQLDWDDKEKSNLEHTNRLGKLTRGQIEAGLEQGYLFWDRDKEHGECRFRYVFAAPPPLENMYAPPSVHCLVIDTSRASLRPVTVFEMHTDHPAAKKYRRAAARMELE